MDIGLISKLTMCSLILLLQCCIFASAAAAASSSSQHWKAVTAEVKAADENDEGEDWTSIILDRSSKNQDTYVSASPLSVAAVCSDGIALVSLHFGLELKNDDESQRPSQKEGEELCGVFHDLPLSSRGPLRIEPIFDNGVSTNSMTSTCPLRSPPSMALLTAGWRTDGMALSDAARELMMEEISLYCLPLSVTMGACTNGDAAMSNAQPSHYGRRIADGLSYYMAKCSFSEGVRSLATIGLLACNNFGGGRLYLVDATGSYSVRAHAIGNGASKIHKRLVFVNFEAMTCLEGIRMLLRIIAEEGGMLSSEKVSSHVGENIKRVGAWTIPHNPGVELAILRSDEQRMRRIRLSSLFVTADKRKKTGKLIE
ncbi:hypothetical protein ACHAXM_003747 [Skeletonema potamos]